MVTLLDVLFILRAIFFTTLEVLWPARVVSYRVVLRDDLIACIGYVWIIFPLASFATSFGYHRWPAAIGTLPLIARVTIYFVLADLGHYWIHRLMHQQFFWRVHKWHHSPTYMYWLGGVRATLPQ